MTGVSVIMIRSYSFLSMTLKCSECAQL